MSFFLNQNITLFSVNYIKKEKGDMCSKIHELKNQQIFDYQFLLIGSNIHNEIQQSHVAKNFAICRNTLVSNINQCFTSIQDPVLLLFFTVVKDLDYD